MELCSKVRIVNKCANALIIMATDILFIFFFQGRLKKISRSEYSTELKLSLALCLQPPPPLKLMSSVRPSTNAFQMKGGGGYLEEPV